jgi:hypothetical protein
MKAPAVERLMPAQQWNTRGLSRPQARTKARSLSIWSEAGRICPSRGSTMSLTPMNRWLPARIVAGRSTAEPTLMRVITWLARVSATVWCRRERGQT